MTRAQERGLCRLMLRLPAWRGTLRYISDPRLLEICEAYALTWDAIEHWSADEARSQEFHAIAAALELEVVSMLRRRIIDTDRKT